MFTYLNLDELMKEALKDPVTLAAAIENDFRRTFATVVADKCKADNIDIKALAASLGIKGVQLRRVLHDEVGGKLALSTLIRLAVALRIPIIQIVMEYNNGNVS